MQRKLNDEFIREYSEEFSENVISDFFGSKSSVSGKEILSLTPSRQVNLFIIKILFRKWQEEMKHLESPYFNYKNPEVRKAMVQFMNILSQHIEVESENLRPMLEQAVADTLLLAADPAGYFSLEFDTMDVPVITDKVSKPILKYIKLHKEEVQDFFEGNADLSLDDFMDAADDYFEEIDVSAVLHQELEAFSKVSVITEEDIYYSDDAIPSFDDDLVGEEEPEVEETTEPEEEPELEEGVFDEAEEEAVEEEYAEESFEPDNYKEEEPEESFQEQEEIADQPEETSEIVEEQPLEQEEQENVELEEPESSSVSTDETDEEEKEKADESINAKYSSQKSTVNDTYGQPDANTLADQMEKRKVKSIMEAISVNHRYMFTKELFDGDRDAFVAAVDQLETAESFDDAVELLVHTYAKERSWDMNSEEVKELLKVVFRKFR